MDVGGGGRCRATGWVSGREEFINVGRPGGRRSSRLKTSATEEGKDWECLRGVSIM